MKEVEMRYYKGKMLDPYPFNELKDVGDEMVVFGVNRLSFQSSAANYGRHHGMKFLTRSLGIIDGKTTVYIRRLPFDATRRRVSQAAKPETNIDGKDAL